MAASMLHNIISRILCLGLCNQDVGCLPSGSKYPNMKYILHTMKTIPNLKTTYTSYLGTLDSSGYVLHGLGPYLALPVWLFLKLGGPFCGCAYNQRYSVWYTTCPDFWKLKSWNSRAPPATPLPSQHKVQIGFI